MPDPSPAHLPSEPAGQRFRALVERSGILQLPGAHNGMAALQAKAAGFQAVYRARDVGFDGIAGSASSRWRR